MHLYLVVKGVEESVQKWKRDLASMWIRLYKKGKPLVEKGKQIYTQVHVREIKLYEIGFPKEEEEQVMNIVGLRKEGSYVLKRYPKLVYIANKLMKFLNLKPAKNPTKPLELMLPNQATKAVAIVPIGVKDDEFNKDGSEQL